MSTSGKSTLVPRLIVLIGVVLIALKVLFGIELLADPMQTVVGGILGIVGVIWYGVAMRKGS